MTTQTSNLAKMQELYKAFGEGNLQAIYDAVSDDIVWSSHSHPSSPFHGVHRGKDGVKGYFGRMEQVDLEKFEPHTFAESGDKVITISNVRRITKATGQVVEGQLVHVWRFAGGKIVQADVYEPSAELD